MNTRTIEQQNHHGRALARRGEALLSLARKKALICAGFTLYLLMIVFAFPADAISSVLFLDVFVITFFTANTARHCLRTQDALALVHSTEAVLCTLMLVRGETAGRQ